jgi:hypothetical protein
VNPAAVSIMIQHISLYCLSFRVKPGLKSKEKIWRNLSKLRTLSSLLQVSLRVENWYSSISHDVFSGRKRLLFISQKCTLRKQLLAIDTMRKNTIKAYDPDN